jgi:hypothetical protein
MAKRVDQGQPLMTAIEQNRIIDGADIALRRELQSPVRQIERNRPTDLIRVQNKTGGNRQRFQVVEIGDRLGTGDLSRSNMIAEAIAVSGADVPFGVLLTDIPTDEFGWCQVSGTCPARISGAGSQRFARPKVAEWELELADSGPVEILTTTASGEIEGLVRFGSVAVGQRKMVDFELTEALETTDATATADIVAEYGPGTAAPAAAITVRNPMGQVFFGAIGDRGLAVWNEENEYVIIQLVQDCTPE